MPKKKMTNNQVLLKEIISQEYSEHKNSFSDEDSYFEFFSAQQYLKNQQLSYEEIMSGLVGGGSDGGYDSIYIFKNNLLQTEYSIDSVSVTKSSELKLILIQSKNETGFSEDTINKWKTSAKNLLDLDNASKKYKSRYDETIRSKFDFFKELIKKGIRSSITIQIEFVYIALGCEIHNNVRQQADELQKEINSMFPAANTSVRFITCDEIMNEYNKSNDEQLTLQFTEQPISAGENHDFLALVKLAEYYKFISDIDGNKKLSLFDMNVRDYQGSNQVNESIFESLENMGEEEFWWLNNGITILADSIIPTTNKIYSLKNPKIVNGMQTSIEIYRYFNLHNERITIDKRNVLVRLIAPKSESSRDKIIFSTNNQTNISKSLLRATDSIQIQIEQYLKNRNIYYDRRKNFYKNQGKKLEDIISMTFLAQCMITIFKQNPDNARMRPSSIINDEKLYSELYNSTIDLDVYYKVSYIGNTIRNYLNCEQGLSKTDKSNILFYFLYAVVNELCNKDINFESVLKIDVNLINKNLLKNIYKSVVKVYKNNSKQSKVSDWKVLFREILEL